MLRFRSGKELDEVETASFDEDGSAGASGDDDDDDDDEAATPKQLTAKRKVTKMARRRRRRMATGDGVGFFLLRHFQAWLIAIASTLVSTSDANIHMISNSCSHSSRSTSQFERFETKEKTSR